MPVFALVIGSLPRELDLWWLSNSHSLPQYVSRDSLCLRFFFGTFYIGEFAQRNAVATAQ
jgi:hypothetical protein